MLGQSGNFQAVFMQNQKPEQCPFLSEKGCDLSLGRQGGFRGQEEREKKLKEKSEANSHDILSTNYQNYGFGGMP